MSPLDGSIRLRHTTISHEEATTKPRRASFWPQEHLAVGVGEGVDTRLLDSKGLIAVI